MIGLRFIRLQDLSPTCETGWRCTACHCLSDGRQASTERDPTVLQRYKGLSDKSITEFKDQRRHPDRREGAQESSDTRIFTLDPNPQSTTRKP